MLQVQQAITYHEGNEEEEEGQLLELELYDENKEVEMIENKLQLVPVNIPSSESDYSLFDRKSKFNILSITSHTTDDGDPFANLHPNWAHLNFKDKKNMVTHTISSVKVTMAINKLEHLQNNIEKWITRLETNQSRLKDSPLLSQSSKRLLEFTKNQSQFCKLIKIRVGSFSIHLVDPWS